MRPQNIGIHAIETYFPKTYISQEELGILAFVLLFFLWIWIFAIRTLRWCFKRQVYYWLRLKKYGFCWIVWGCEFSCINRYVARFFGFIFHFFTHFLCIFSSVKYNWKIWHRSSQNWQTRSRNRDSYW